MVGKNFYSPVEFTRTIKRTITPPFMLASALSITSRQQKGGNMKKLVFLVLIAGVIGCNEIKTPVESTNLENTTAVEWAPVFGVGTKSLQKTISLAKEIDGAVGGIISYRSTLSNGVDLDYQLQFLPGSFDGIKTITVNLDSESFTGDYSPHGYFYKPAVLSVVVKNADLSFINSEDELRFVYVSQNGELEYLDYRKLKVDLDKGELDLRNAELPHFSRYGFTR